MLPLIPPAQQAIGNFLKYAQTESKTQSTLKQRIVILAEKNAR